jgi:hypothetical protein
MTNDNFLGISIQDLVNNQITVHLDNKKRVANGIDGFFDYEAKKIQVATQNEMFIEIFLHEYCHFLQFKEKEENYKQLCDGLFYQWMSGFHNEVPQKKILTSMINCIILEHDCDRRALAIIDKYKLNINKEEYTKLSSAYILSHWFSLEFRKRPNYLFYVAEKMSNKIRNITYYLNRNNYLKFRELFLKK